MNNETHWPRRVWLPSLFVSLLALLCTSVVQAQVMFS